MLREPFDVLVLGAGPAGLATALLAARRGLRVCVVERGEVVGGLARSETVDGVRVDLGSHRLHHATPPDVLALLTDLLGDDLQSRPRHGRVLLEGRWLGFPLRAGELARGMPPRWLARVAREAVRNPERTDRPTSYAAALRSSLGPTAYGSIYGPFAEKLWGLPGERIDVEQARVRVTADTPAKVADRVLRTSLARRRRGAAPGPRGTGFRYPRAGFGQIVEALADAARAAGAEVRLGCEVTAVTPGSPVVVRTGDGATLTAHRVLSTLPLPVLGRLADPGPPDDVVSAARALRMRAMLLVYLTHRPARSPGPGDPPARWTPYDAHYLPAPGTPVSRISEPANYRDSAADPTDRSVVCAEVPCDVGDVLWEADEETLGAVVTDALARHGLPPIALAGVAVRRVPAVYPVYEHGFAERLDTLERWAADLPGVTTFGRAGLFAHDNTHHALVMAHAVVACLGPDGAFDDVRWAASRESFRGHVVED